jgi:hypothetical protein
MHRVRLVVVASSALVASAALAKGGGQATMEAQLEALKPGLGETMSVIQPHHAKLYYAVKAENWPLAEYEADEVAEGLDAAVKNWPRFKDVKRPLTELVPAFTEAPLTLVGEAIKKRSKAGALEALDKLTAGCNGCHAAAAHGFIVIQAPQADEYSNQKFVP